ncbi:hypothetical protein F2Q69_00026545 [Brassica cretica]|uniref:Uncharacterized protein n=1 Tax=Brassica cretica TaxID=69181 RepID=A0A8S9RRL5_BRACR|nr:hypothetical protein F2Q69_00026545 [Brassica cretica]
MNVRGNIPTKFSLGIFRGHFRQTSGPRNFLGSLFPRNSVGKFRGIFEGRRNSEELFSTTCFVVRAHGGFVVAEHPASIWKSVYLIVLRESTQWKREGRSYDENTVRNGGDYELSGRVVDDEVSFGGGDEEKIDIRATNPNTIIGFESNKV